MSAISACGFLLTLVGGATPSSASTVHGPMAQILPTLPPIETTVPPILTTTITVPPILTTTITVPPILTTTITVPPILTTTTAPATTTTAAATSTTASSTTTTTQATTTTTAPKSTTTTGTLPATVPATTGPTRAESTTTTAVSSTTSTGPVSAVQPSDPGDGALSSQGADAELNGAGGSAGATFLAFGSEIEDRHTSTVGRVPLRAQLESATFALGWLFDRDPSGFALAVFSPFLALMTIWDAIMSAGSGLVAPTVGLAAVVAVAIVDRRSLFARLRRNR